LATLRRAAGLGQRWCAHQRTQFLIGRVPDSRGTIVVAAVSPQHDNTKVKINWGTRVHTAVTNAIFIGVSAIP
jgi:hypothetical protein